MVASFIPTSGEDSNDDERYRALATLVRCPPDMSGKRIEPATWESRGETWVASVGETLHGTRKRLIKHKVRSTKYFDASGSE